MNNKYLAFIQTINGHLAEIGKDSNKSPDDIIMENQLIDVMKVHRQRAENHKANPHIYRNAWVITNEFILLMSIFT